MRNASNDGKTTAHVVRRKPDQVQAFLGQRPSVDVVDKEFSILLLYGRLVLSDCDERCCHKYYGRDDPATNC